MHMVSAHGKARKRTAQTLQSPLPEAEFQMVRLARPKGPLVQPIFSERRKELETSPRSQSKVAELRLGPTPRGHHTGPESLHLFPTLDQDKLTQWKPGTSQQSKHMTRLDAKSPQWPLRGGSTWHQAGVCRVLGQHMLDTQEGLSGHLLNDGVAPWRED